MARPQEGQFFSVKPTLAHVSYVVNETMVHRAKAERAARLAGLVTYQDEHNDSNEEPVVGGIQERGNRYRSIDADETSPVDNIIIDTVAPIAITAVEYGVVPNHLSIVGGVLALAALVALWFDYLVLFVLLFSLSYILDVMDGWLARSYFLYSPWGEALDHGKDMLVVVALAVVLVFKVRPPPLAVVAVAILYGIALVGESCSQRAIQERRRAAGMQQGAAGDNMLDAMTALCPPGADPTVTRHFATPSFLVVGGGAVLLFATVRRLGLWGK